MKKLKKPTVTMLLAVMIISNAQGLVAYANEEVTKNKLEVKEENTKVELQENQEQSNREETREDKSEKITDITPPAVEISSLKIDKKEVKPGDTVNISIKATDDMSGIDSIYVWYCMPITGKSEHIKLSYNSITDRYEGSMYIDENKEAGLWEINYIYASDKLDNEVYIKNSNTNNYGDIREDLSSGNFNVSGTDTDVTPPEVEISSLKIDKKEVKPGDTVNISIKATDDMSGIDSIYVWYCMPITGKSE
ncbi:hypothetical protein, partial [Paraclostridium bifermentans]|uniref:hypothetical protein n=1 Tax=Paraclostridium bifermentans TaxID=1490 RepID=UPI00359C27E9